MHSLTFHSLVDSESRYRYKSTISFHGDMEPQGIGSNAGHHLPFGGEGSVVISKGKPRIIIIYTLLSI